MASVSDLKNKKVLVVGLGKEGIDNILFLKKKGICSRLGVADRRSYEKLSEEEKSLIQEGVSLHFGKNYLDSVPHYDVIIKSPGVPLSKIKKKKWQIITSQSDIFLNDCKGTVIGVTGTKGKSTTCSLLYQVFSKAGIKSHLVGNIGNPALSLLGEENEDDLFVYELSSFQLATVTSSPKVAIILNLYIDHLDNHENFKDYMEAKKNITRYQDKEDVLIFNANDKNVIDMVKGSLAKKIPFYPSMEKSRKDIATPLSPIYILGERMGVREEFIEEAVSEFKPLPHRMEFVGEFNGSFFYNDSAGTIPEATIKAIRTINGVDTLIAGGVDKGGDYSSLAREIEKSEIRNLILFKESGEKIEKELKKSSDINLVYAADMSEAVDIALKSTKKGSSCLLSPASSSFNMFRDYKERGDLFKKYLLQR